jgi:hypothetical protein
MGNQTSNGGKSGGVGFTTLLALLFIGLKLTGYIAWSWVWVLSPIWIVFALVFAFIILAALTGK